MPSAVDEGASWAPLASLAVVSACSEPNCFQQLGIASGDGSSNGAVPVPLSAGGAKARLLGRAGAATCAVTREDELYCWGDNFGGLAGGQPEATDAGLTNPVMPTPNELVLDQMSVGEIDALAGGAAHFALLGGGYVWTWGSSFFGQLARSDVSPCEDPVYDYSCSPIPGFAIQLSARGTGVVAASTSTCVITEQKEVQCLFDGTLAIAGVPVDDVAYAAGATGRNVICAWSTSKGLVCGGSLNINNSQGSATGDFATLPELVQVALPESNGG